MDLFLFQGHLCLSISVKHNILNKQMLSFAILSGGIVINVRSSFTQRPKETYNMKVWKKKCIYVIKSIRQQCVVMKNMMHQFCIKEYWDALLRDNSLDVLNVTEKPLTANGH